MEKANEGNEKFHVSFFCKVNDLICRTVVIHTQF
jgi:hypothetical protein